MRKFTGRAGSLARSLLESDEWRFTSNVTAENLTIIGKSPDELVTAALRIDWEVLFEVREWGIKDINIQVHGVKLVGAVETHDGEFVRNITFEWPDQEKRPPGNAEEPTEKLAVYMTRPRWDIQWEFGGNGQYGVSVHPKSAAVNLARHTVEIVF